MTDHTELTPEGYVLTLDALAQAWPVRGVGCIMTVPAFVPPSDTSEVRLDFAIGKAQTQLDHMGSNPVRWPFLGYLLRREGR